MEEANVRPFMEPRTARRGRRYNEGHANCWYCTKGRAMSTGTKTERPGLSWEKISHDPRFHDLPYKVETNARGQIVMSPTYQYHGALQSEITGMLREMLPGQVVTESAIATTDGEKVADVAWFSDERWEQVKDALEAPVAPEICVEVHSPGNTDEEMAHKRRLYFEAGAHEVWMCDGEGRLSFFTAGSKIDCSRLAPDFPSRIEI